MAQHVKPRSPNRRNVQASGRIKRPKRRWLREILIAAVLASISLYLLVAGLVFALRWVNPVTTMVQVERRVEAWRAHRPYKKRYQYEPLSRIAPNLQHAVISAEDGRFFQHHGFDWVEMQKVLEDDIRNDRLGRGGSTITQQLVKNLFLTTERSLVRKAVESTVVPIVEGLLTKRRILELYLNVIEWGPGVYGAQAAAEYYYRENASALSRDQSARLAAIIPAPLKRKPAQMNRYTAEIENRMEKTGW